MIESQMMERERRETGRQRGAGERLFHLEGIARVLAGPSLVGVTNFVIPIFSVTL